MAQKILARNWVAPGPVAAAMMRSEAKIQAILGPQGSGKTSTALMKMLKLATLQPPGPNDNVRRFKVCAVRDTYRQLWKTTIKSWWDWVPKDAPRSTWIGSDGNPATHSLDIPLGDGTRLQFTIEFVAIGDASAEDVLRGYEVTAFYLNEADLLDPSVLKYARGRTGRFPRRQGDFQSRWHGVIIDFNAPDVDNYLYKICVEDKLSNLEFFQQPSGMSPRAENLQNLVENYYEDMAEGQEAWWVRRMVHAQWGYSRDGMPVYPNFNDQIHVAGHTLAPARGVPLLIGLDAGRTPGAVFGQYMPTGQMRWLRELAAVQMGAERFGEEIAAMMVREFPDWDPRQIEGWGDPAAAHPGDQDDRSYLEIVSAASGIQFWPAPVARNDITIRLEAVRKPLTRLADDGQPGFLLDPGCRILRKGFNSHYRYKLLRVPGAVRYETKPEKNDYSHPHDAGQYLNIGAGIHNEIFKRHEAKRQSANSVRRSVAQGFRSDERGGVWDENGVQRRAIF